MGGENLIKDGGLRRVENKKIIIIKRGVRGVELLKNYKPKKIST